MRIHESAGAVNRANAVAVAISAEARIVFPREHSMAQRFDVRLDWLGMNAAEARVARSADFVARNSVAADERPQEGRRRSRSKVEDQKPDFGPQGPPRPQLFYGA